MASRVKIISGEQDGATAVAHELDTVENFTTDGAKLLSVKNAGAEVLEITKDGIFKETGNLIIVEPSEGYAGVQTAVDTLNAAGGGIIQLLAGEYDFTTGYVNKGDCNNITIQGMGDATIINAGSTYVFRFYSGSTISTTPLNSASVGNSSVFATTPSHGSRFFKGAILNMYGTDDNTGYAEFQYNIVAEDGNPSSGEVKLEIPLVRNFDPLTTIGTAGSSHNTIKDLRIIGVSGTPYHIVGTNANYTRVENVTFEGTSHLSGGTIRFDSGGSNQIIKNCRFYNTDGISILTSGRQQFVEILNNQFISTNEAKTVHQIPINISSSSDLLIEGNLFQSVGAPGGMGVMWLHPDTCRCIIKNNVIYNAENYAFRVEGRSHIITDNVFADASNTTTAAIYILGSNACIIMNNSIIQSYTGIAVNTNVKGSIVANNNFKSITGTGVVISTERAIIQNNTFFDVATPLNGSNINNVVVNSNTIDGSSGNAFTMGLRNSTIANNIIRNTGGSAMYQNGYRNTICNNVCLDVVGNGIICVGAYDFVAANNILDGGFRTSDPVSPKNGDYIVAENQLMGGGMASPGTGTGKDFINNKE